MALQPNLGGIARVCYVLVGAGLAAWGLFGAETQWVRVVLPIVGAITLLEGVIGF